MSSHEIEPQHENIEECEQPQRTPLPRLQVAIAYMIAGAEPFACTVIYPFVNQFVRELGVTGGDERKTGYYAGIIESIYYVAECSTTIFWGRASDRWGRRPLLLAATLGLAFSMFGFGMSSRFWMLLASRCAQGAFNGNIGVVKNVLAEITDSTNRAVAFSFYSPVWAAGSTFGPLVGGGFSRPAQRWPETFGKIQFFVDHPYFLPCAIAGFFSIVSFIVSSLFLRETLPSIVARRRAQSKLNHSPSASTALLDGTNGATYGTTRLATDDDTSDCSSTCPSINSLSSTQTFSSPPVLSVLTRPVCIAMTNLALLAFTDGCYQALLPLMYSTSIPLGGLGFTPARIGTILGIWGVTNGILNVLLFPLCIRKFGPWAVYRASYSSYIVSIGSFPLMTLLVKGSGEVNGWVVAIIVGQLTAVMGSFFAYGAAQMFIIDAMPNPESMATINAIAQVASSSVRALAPSFSSSLFSLSLEHQLLGGYMVYVVLGGVILIGLHATSKLPRHLTGKI